MAEDGAVKTGRVGKSPTEFGRYTYGYDQLLIKQWGEGASLKIGGFCSLADGITIILGGNHRADWITTFPFGHIFTDDLGGKDIIGHPATNGDVVIGNDVWIGRNATILSGITVADGAVIAANSVVTRNIGAYEIWGGNPAKKIRERFSEEIIGHLLDLKWWDLDVDIIKKIVPLLSTPPDLKTMEKIKSLTRQP